MIIFVQGPNDRKRIDIGLNDKLCNKIKEIFKIEKFSMSFDQKNTKVIDINKTPQDLNLYKGIILYIHYDIIKKDIKREKDKFMCSHEVNAMCPNCAPLDPWDEKYYKDKKIKYLSFGSYKEMCKKNNTEIKMENYTSTVCKDHSKNTRCVNCEEKDIYLTPQIYRMVDHIEFDDAVIVENFIKQWRDSKKQYFGILVGKYKSYDRSPLGLKAVVSGIWIPEQENYPDGFVIKENLDDDFLLHSNLSFLGMIYTDLIFDKQIMSKRNEKNYFLSSLEIEFIAKMQFMFPYMENNILFNSRFVTCLISANEYGDIEINEYQVSSQCMALTRSQFILPTNNSFFYTKKNVFYKEIQDDSLVTTKADKILPSEYFIIKLTSGTKQNPIFKNNSYISNIFTNQKMADYFEQQFTFEKFSNFSLLMKIKDRVSDFNRLLKCIVEDDKKYFERFTRHEDYKNILESLTKFHKVIWTCEACTFINEHSIHACEVCGTPKTT